MRSQTEEKKYIKIWLFATAFATSKTGIFCISHDYISSRPFFSLPIFTLYRFCKRKMLSIHFLKISSSCGVSFFIDSSPVSQLKRPYLSLHFNNQAHKIYDKFGRYFKINFFSTHPHQYQFKHAFVSHFRMECNCPVYMNEHSQTLITLCQLYLYVCIK